MLNWLRKLFIKKENQIPCDLNTTLKALNLLLNAEEKKMFYELSEKEFIAKTHHTLGRHIRNVWKLWDEKSKMYKWFKSIEIWHADDMSGMILTTYYRITHGLPINIKKQIKDYKDYWKNDNIQK